MTIVSVDKIQCRKKNGFSLLELMIVIAIIGIVSAIAIPSYLSWRPGNIFRGAVSRVERDLNQAKLRPYETRRQCRLVFNANGYQIEDGDQASGSAVWTPLRVVSLTDDYPQITLTGAAGALPITYTPIFSPKGTATLGTIVVHYANDTDARFPARSVAVNITGRVNVQ